MNVLKRNPPVTVEFRLPHPAGWEAAPVEKTETGWDGGEESNRRWANGLAAEMAEEKQVPEVRWNFAGCSQGHYVKGVGQ